MYQNKVHQYIRFFSPRRLRLLLSSVGQICPSMEPPWLGHTGYLVMLIVISIIISVIIIAIVIIIIVIVIATILIIHPG